MIYNDFKALCEERRSVRFFDEKPVTKEEVLQLLELARLAPSVENLQPWHFHIILSKDMRHALTESSCYGNFVEGSSAFIVVTANRSLENQAKDPVWNERELEYSCMAAMTNILHGATAMGIGSCWVSLHHGAVHELLQLPMHERIIGGIMLGHFKKGQEKGDDGHKRNALSEIYTIHD
jgi:nitroreductase